MMLLFLVTFLLAKPSATSASRLLKPDPCIKATVDVKSSEGITSEMFYVDGKLVDQFSFCEALRESYEQHCSVSEDIRNRYCHVLETPHLSAKRQEFRNLGFQERSNGSDSSQNPNSYWFKPKTLAMTVPVFFLLGCTLICPCFQARKKAKDEPDALSSISSLEMNAAFEKIPGSPWREPPSPWR
ncbi:hypothetical protein M569_06179, partial [Genlisea aurea]